MAKFLFKVSTNAIGSGIEEIVEIPDEEFEGMTEKEKHEYVSDVYEDWVWNNINTDFVEV